MATRSTASVGRLRGLSAERATFVLALMLAVSALAILPRAAQAKNPYCGEFVPPYTDCAKSPGKSGDWFDGYPNTNEAYHEGSSVADCEHTYIYGTGDTVSDRCGTGVVKSECDLYFYYNNHYALSSHAGNNGNVERIIWGYAYIQSPEFHCS